MATLGMKTCAISGIAEESFLPRAFPYVGSSRSVHFRQRHYNTCVLASATDAEPKWKQKLAAADAHQERTRQLTMKAQEEYKRRQLQQQQQRAGGSEAALEDLEFVPYLTSEGKINDVSQADAKATVYAIFDNQKQLQYVGITRQVYQSMRLHFARMPRLCCFVKFHNITRPSRALLESIRDSWEKSSPSPPPGNDNGPQQNLWENPLDCKPLMTDEERAAVEAAAPGPAKGKALKMVARRLERELEDAFKEAGCTDVLRFDPKLKEEGLLDLKSTAYANKPDSSVPSGTPKAANPAPAPAASQS
eukprot:TRINITY_DN5922_c0_g1_i1.p1 TRINITY_DN5922_c0_g1~~TRINITY_DN5922_c0_g1_i1.p1  ORF type:complete len:305 (-),score=75.71 TRINITY_DN5922_c0_g1_i1:101-1015(-)